MSESADFSPGVWKGHDFGAARSAFDRHAGRSYADAKANSKSIADLVPASLTTNSSSPLVIVSDVTGSMGEWPATMFSKLPYLELEGKEYLGEDMEICFAAVGDAYTDSYPLQVRPFSAGVDLKDQLQALVIEGNGGGQKAETYELGAGYFAWNVSMPNAIRPILIMIGDEAPYDFVNPDHTKKFAYHELDERMLTAQVFAELRSKFAVYLILKPYSNSWRSSANVTDPTSEMIRQKWLKYFDADHIVDLPVADRVVDVIFGILAKETGRIDYFRKELEGRQRPDQVETVFKSLKTVHAIAGPPAAALPAGSSVLRDGADGTESRPLL